MGGEAGCFIPMRAGFPIVWDRISRAIEAGCDDKTVNSPVLRRQDVIVANATRNPNFRQDVKPREAGCVPKRWQGVAVRFCSKNKIVSLLPDHRLLLVKRLLTGLQRDDTKQKAGDEIRTRDSLLGRQAPPISPLASSKTALQADRTLVKQMCAGLT
jgi:hypothetical protein